jgi:hypothetical protein
MTTYRIFVEDVGAGLFSAYGSEDIRATSPLDAIFAGTKIAKDSPVGRRWLDGRMIPSWCGRRLIALPHDRKDLWPDGQTGKVPKEALTFCF